MGNASLLKQKKPRLPCVYLINRSVSLFGHTSLPKNHISHAVDSITNPAGTRRRSDVGIRDLTILGRQRAGDGQNKLLQINGSKDSSSYIINRMNLIQF
jgi:hypothetical protein